MSGPSSVVPSRRAASIDLEHRLALRSRLAGLGLASVLLAVSVFAVWSSHATGSAANDAVAAARLSDDYASAATAVAAMESTAGEYRLAPGKKVRARFDRAAGDFITAMKDVGFHGDADDRALADRLLGQHRAYLRGIDKQFAAADRGDQAEALRLDSTVTDRPFDNVERAILAAAGDTSQRSMARLRTLSDLEGLTRLLTPLVFLLGLVIAALFALVTRGHGRVLLQERAQAVRDALHDPLSGLPNRTLLHDRLDEALRGAARAGTSAALLLIDLDRFKEVNDTFGHKYGDALLQQIGPRLTTALGPDDTLARLGGDEFAVLLPSVRDSADAMGMATQLRAALEAPFRVFGVDLNVDASVGVVISGQHGWDSGTLLRRADIAMHFAKARAMGASVYTADGDEHSPVRLALIGELREALSRGDLVLHYQPKIDIDSGRLVGVEALVRWHHRSRGLVLPDEFLPLAEHTDLIGPLTWYVLDAALADARRWAAQGPPLAVSVNLSARNLHDPNLPDTVAGLLTAHAVAPEQLVIEVTESALMSDPLRARQVLMRLAESGVGISIDDFGAGYTSLSQLKTLPINELKIDKSFVIGMATDHGNALIVESVIDLGHNLGIKIVAEGVEDEHTMDVLRRFGCDVVQGYHFSKPVPAARFERWRATRERHAQPPDAAQAPTAARRVLVGAEGIEPPTTSL